MKLFIVLLLAAALCVTAISEGASAERTCAATRYYRSTVSELVGLLSSGLSIDRFDAALELGRRGDVSVIPAMKAALGDPERFVRMRIAAALLDLGDRSGVEVLHEVVTSGEPYWSLAAAEVLAHHGDTFGRDLIRKAHSSSSWVARSSALRASADLPEGPPYDAVAAGLEDSQQIVRLTALRAAQMCHDPRVKDLVRKALSSSDTLLRARAAIIIAEEGQPADIPALIALLTAPDGVTRSAVLRALQSLTGRASPSKTVLTLKAATAIRAEWEQWWAENQSQFPPGTKIKAEAGAPSVSPGPAAQP
ncbi:MAG: HEAT repeat domain-containing protein [Armatimonadetes bacterium]|nr:HEAT repeat domain-containing protein [Armatimonadota bacterium]